MAESSNAREIEANLKKILNIVPSSSTQSSGSKVTSATSANQVGATQSSSIVLTNTDLQHVGNKKLETTDQSTKKKNRPKKKDKKKGEHNQKDGEPRHDSLADKPQNEEGENNDKKKKKNRKHNRKKYEPKTKVPDATGSTSMTGVTGVVKKEDSDTEEEDKHKVKPNKPVVPVVQEVKLNYLDDKLTVAVQHELQIEGIFPLKKKSPKFPFAKYFCRLCDYHCDNVPVCRQHANDARHRRRKEIQKQDKKLKELPKPSERQLEALDTMIEAIYQQYGLCDQDLIYRHGIATQLEGFITANVTDVSLHLRVYGSSLTGFGLKSSDLNMDLICPEGSSQAQCLSKVYKTLKQSDQYTNVRSDFQAKVPSVLLTSSCRRVQCQITVGSDSAYFTSEYLTLYSRLDDRVRKLAVTYRYWAQVCQVADQEAGSLPSYTFGLMTIYFLQQVKPHVLPVLWKDVPMVELKKATSDEIKTKFDSFLPESWQTDNQQSVGCLWRNLLLFYGVYFDLNELIICIRSPNLVHRSEKKWKSKRVAIEDPFSCKRNVARSLHNTRIFEYFYNCLRKACIYFSLPTTHQNIEQYYASKRNTSHSKKALEQVSKAATNEQVEDSSIVGECVEISHKNLNQESHSIVEVQNVNHTEQDSKGCLKDQAEELNDEDESESATDDSGDKIEKELTQSTELSSDCSIRENKFFADAQAGVSTEVSELDESFSKCTVDDSVKVCAVADEDVTHLDNDSRCSCTSPSERAAGPSSIDSEKDNVEQKHCSKCNKFASKKTEQVSRENIDGSDNNVCSKALTYSPNTLRNINTHNDANSPNLPQEIKEELANTFKPDTSKKVRNKTIESSEIHEEKTVQHDAANRKGTVENENNGKEVESSIDNDIDKHEGNAESGSDIEESDHSESGTDSDMEPETPDSSPLKRKKRVSSPVGAEYEYMFSLDTLTDGKGPSVFCQICEKEGHLKMSCPEDKLPDIIELPPLHKEHIQILTRTIKHCPRDFQLSKEEIADREFIIRNLESHIQETFEDAELCLFGSSMNGFGFHHSDLDICVTFRDKNPEDINFVEHIEAICKKLKSHRGLFAVFPITTAKVPIVKFKHRNSQLEGDISLYNILAQQNTQLLHTYANIDPRVLILGFAIKVFAKVCDIGDASRGSLSSYAYMLMMLHYLQHSKPPVIPVLQELRDPDDPEPVMMIEGWNAWFYDDLNKLPEVWPGYGMNQESVGELWIGFFRYYLEEFSFMEQVVTIRQFEPLSKFEKLWNGKCIAVEDPFDMNHNLGGGLSRKMNQYIMRTFLHARELYGIPITRIPDGFKSTEDYFFDKSQLTEGDPPSDRLCRVCSKIGHIARECPRVMARKEREASEKQRREDKRIAQEERDKASSDRHRERGQPSRSLSDPTDSSPSRSSGQTFYNRQHSYEQSPDKRQIRPLMDIPVQLNFSQDNYSRSSPQRIPGQNYNPERRPQSHSPNSYGYNAMNQSGQGQSPRSYGYNSASPQQQFYRPNQNDNNKGRYNQHGNNNNKNIPQFSMNQNIDYREGSPLIRSADRQAGYSANSKRDYSSTSNQNRPYINRNHPEGSRQVLVVSNSTLTSGQTICRNNSAGIVQTNPLLIPNKLIPIPALYSSYSNLPANVVLQTASQYLPLENSQHDSMNRNISRSAPVHVNQNFMDLQPVQFTDRQPVNFSGNTDTTPVCPQSWYQAMSTVNTGPFIQSHVQLGTEIKGASEMTDRHVNIQKTSQALPDVGVTVKNEYYKGPYNK